jgi:hypothetical protein
MMTTHEIRNQRLMDLSKMVINGSITQKLDHLATIYINNNFYFSVYRRYNSPYNIVIEDKNDDIYLHQDHTIRTSLKTVLCLDDYLTSKIYTLSATSYKHNGPVPSMDRDIADMRWTELQGNYHAVVINFGGIFYDELTMDNYWENVPSTPIEQIIPPSLTPPAAPTRPINDDANVANILLTLNIPAQDNIFKMSESDGPTLSMRFADIKKRVPVCYCEMDDSDDESYDEYEDEDEDEDDEKNYIVLRNGIMIPKIK